jgi:hypothetical protein
VAFQCAIDFRPLRLGQTQLSGAVQVQVRADLVKRPPRETFGGLQFGLLTLKIAGALADVRQPAVRVLDRQLAAQ